MVCGVLTVLMVSYSALTLLVDVNAQLIPDQLLWLLILTKTIAAFELFLPLALFITILMGLGKLYADHEIVSLQASGMSLAAIIKVLMPLILLVTLLSTLVATLARPWAYGLKYEARHQAGQTIDFDQLQAGSFYLNEDADTVYFTKRVSPDGDLKGEIFIYQRFSDKVEVIAAQQAQHMTNAGSDDLMYRFEQGSASVLPHDGNDTYIEFKHMTLVSELEEKRRNKYKRKAASTAFLSTAKKPADIAEFQWRITAPVKTLLLAVIAILMARTSSRQGRYGKLVGGVCIFFAFHGLGIITKTWVEQGLLSTMPGLWWVVMILSALSYLLLRRVY